MSPDVHLLLSTSGANAVVFAGGVMVIVSTGTGQQGALVVQIAVSSLTFLTSGIFFWTVASPQNIVVNPIGVNKPVCTSIHLQGRFLFSIYTLKLSVKRDYEINAMKILINKMARRKWQPNIIIQPHATRIWN